MHSLCTAFFSHLVFVLPGFTKPLQNKNDTSNTAVCGFFTQELSPVNIPIAFLRKISTSCKKDYSFNNCELLVVVIYCKAWRPYIDRQ